MTFVQVPKHAPASREQWQDWNRVWPISWRKPELTAVTAATAAARAVTLAEKHSIHLWMDRAYALAEVNANSGSVRNAAVIVDPVSGELYDCIVRRCTVLHCLMLLCIHNSTLHYMALNCAVGVFVLCCFGRLCYIAFQRCDHDPGLPSATLSHNLSPWPLPTHTGNNAACTNATEAAS